MRLWLNRNGNISLRNQLVTQIVLAILSREIQPGQRLPSTRELGRRFGIHPNTASSAYKQLEKDGWIEFRHGSGVYARSNRPPTSASPQTAADHLVAAQVSVDQLIIELVARARRLGASDRIVRERFMSWLAMAPPRRWLLIEPDIELRKIVMLELEDVLLFPVEGCTPQDCSAPEILDGAVALVLPSKASAVRKLLPAGMELTTLEVSPVGPELESHLKRYLPEHKSDLIAVASRWTDFRRNTQTMLLAVGLKPENLLVRDATQPGWKRGLGATSGVVCDSAIARELPKGCFPLVYRLIANGSIEQLQRMESALNSASTASLAV